MKFARVVICVAVSFTVGASARHLPERPRSVTASSRASFVPVGAMSVTRFFHTATLLGNGKVLIAGGVTTSGPTDTAEIFDPVTGSFTPLPNKLSVARYEHTATMLPTGKVLLLGGTSTSGITNSGELFDPVAGTFTPLAPQTMTSARANHTATLLANGNVLIIGGFNGSSHVNTAEIFDSAAQTFSAISPNTMTTARSEHTATLLRNGKVLITGGYNGTYLDSTEICDPAAGTFVGGPTMLSVRDRHTATLLPNGKVLVAGGYTGNLSVTTDTAELFDASTNSFTPAAPMSAPRQFHSATLLGDGTVLVAGGSDGVLPTNTADIFDPATNTFTSTAPSQMVMARDVHTATLLPNGHVLFAGGNTVGLPQNTNSAEIFDPASSGAFTPVPNPMMAARYVHTATQLPTGDVLIAGGAGSGAAVNTAELFHPANGTFTALPDLNSPRLQHTATLLGGNKVLLAGGFTGSGGAAASAELYDVSAQTFTPTGNDMATSRLQHTATLLRSGEVLIAGGSDATLGGYTKKAELFDPASSLFTPLDATMKFERQNHTATLLLSGEVLLAGGGSGGGINSTAELFDPATKSFTSLEPNNMTSPRYVHTATLLPNAKVLLAGGHNGSAALNTAELFEPATNSFRALASTMSSTRYFHTATLLTNGKVLIAGGNTGPGAAFSNTAELFDPATETFTLLSPNNMTTGRYSHSATVLLDGRVLVAGGSTSNGVTSAAELFQLQGIDDSRRPIVATAPGVVALGGKIALSGAKFRGDSEASTSAGQSSATNYPLLELRRLDNDEATFIASDPNLRWTDDAFVSKAIASVGAGPYRLTVYTNAVPSLQKLVSVTLPELTIVSITQLANGHMLIDARGIPNLAHTIEASPDLSPGSFAFLATVLADENGVVTWQDADAADLAKRFYRLVYP